MVRLIVIALLVALLAACGLALRSGKLQRVDLFGLASLSVPANLKLEGGIRSAGPHSFSLKVTVPLAEAGDPDAAAFVLALPAETDWGGISHDTAVLTVVLFRAGLADAAYGIVRKRHADPLDPPATPLRAKAWPYDRNLTKKPASTAVYEDPGRRFLIHLSGWDNKFPLEQKKKTVEDAAKSLQMDEAKLLAHLDYIAQFPERMRTRVDASAGVLAEKFAAAGFPKPVRDAAVEHDGFVYTIGGEPPEFAILYPLGDLAVADEVRDKSRPVEVPDDRQGLLGWYRFAGERWEFTLWGFPHSSWEAIDRAMLPRLRDPRRVYFYVYWSERLRFEATEEVAGFDLPAFLERARKLRARQSAGELFRPLP